MFWNVVFVFFAAFGLLCALWALFGHLLPGSGSCEIAVLSPKERELALIRRFCWLRGLGFTRATLTVLDSGLNRRQRQYLKRRYPYIRFCARQSWHTGHREERTDLATGNGDSTGNHRSGGISEL